MPRDRRKRAGPAFLVLWMTLWLAAILIAVWTMGSAALSGEPAAAIFLFLWVGAALFALVSAGRSLLAMLLGERRAPRRHRSHRWNDGFDTPPPAPEPKARPVDTPQPPDPSEPGRRS